MTFFHFRFIFKKKGKDMISEQFKPSNVKYFIAFFLHLADSSTWTNKMHLNTKQKTNKKSKNQINKNVSYLFLSSSMYNKLLIIHENVGSHARNKNIETTILN